MRADPHAMLGSSLVVRALQGVKSTPKGGGATVLIVAAPASLTAHFPFFPFWPMTFHLTPRIPILPRAAGHQAKTGWVGALEAH